MEVLVEQNINGRTDTTYTYGVDRISKELFNQTNRTAYYLYDPRGSVAGLADAKGHLTKTYQYSATGELTHGAAAYENEYAYNGESYNPNIQSQYLRARYYSVVMANFLTEDSYLGSINEPLTLNRYNYCISSYPNYEDPSGNSHNEYHPQAEMMEYMYWLTGDEKYSEFAEELYEQQIEMEYYEASTSAGVVDSMIAAPANTVILVYNAGATVINLTQSYFARELGEEYGDKRCEYPVPLIPWDTADNYLENNASKVWNMESYHIGRCGGDVLVTAGSLLASVYGIYNICNGLKNVPAWIRSGSNGSKWLVFTNGLATERTLGLVTSGAKALNVVGTALADAVAYDALTDFRDRVSRIGGDKGTGDGPASSWGKGPQISDRSKELWGQGSFDSVEDSLRYHFKEHGKEVGAADIDQYVRKAENFSWKLGGARKSYPPNGTPGAIRYTKNGKYIIIGPDGKILSFGLAR